MDYRARRFGGRRQNIVIHFVFFDGYVRADGLKIDIRYRNAQPMNATPSLDRSCGNVKPQRGQRFEKARLMQRKA
jgi:hypothetical protein